MSGDIKKAFITVLTAIFLALSYIGIGFGICSGSPEPTRFVASATVDDSSSPFEAEQLVRGAVATQEYSFAAHDLDSYLNAILQMNKDAKTPYAEYEPSQMTEIPTQYGITQDEIDHLDDVYSVSEKFFYPILSISVLAAFMLMVLYRFFGIEALSRSLLWGGIGTIAFIIIVLIFALVSFNGLFSVFHSLFFADGSWLFPADSLLITMLPTNFWIGIGGLWMAISALLAVASIAVGIVAKRKS